MKHYLDDDPITPPKAVEFELTFFGPGLGESVVVHLPGVGWGVIDSCEFGTANQRIVPPLKYLVSQNVTKLAFLVLTHPHADHYKGMEKIVDHYLGKIDRVCRYAGDSVRELRTYLVNKGQKGIGGGAAALAKVFIALKKAIESGADGRHLGAMTQVIPRMKATEADTEFEVEVLSLSPSSEDEDTYADALRKAFPERNKPLREIPDKDHNLIATAIRISVGNTVAILGSDVEKGNSRSSGWRGIVGSLDVPELSVQALKVPHHGSSNAHYQKAWDKHCSLGKITSIVTPYARGTHPLPSKEDIERIGIYSKDVGLTSHVSYLRPLEVYGRTVARRLPSKWKVVQSPKECGMITIRYDLEGNKTLHKAFPPASWLKIPEMPLLT